MRRGRLQQSIPKILEDELFTPLAGAGNVRVERIVSRGHRSPSGFWYDQNETEFVLVVAGRSRLSFEGAEEIELGPGDWIEIPARCRHRVAWTAPDEDTIWLAVFY